MDRTSSERRAFWWVILPLKDTRAGKTRIHLDPPARADLARAMARDTLTAVLAAQRVDRVVLVCEDLADAALVEHPRLLVHLDQARRGLNPAITAGATLARTLAPCAHLAALPADLPALTGPTLDHALESAATHERAFLTDQAGIGTTLLTAAPGHALDPHYGPHSRARHAATGAVELTDPALEPLRSDVDDLDALRCALGRAPALGEAPALGKALCH
ncbi:MAG TPA: 2-phospho-L-lactate guanylyltransferase [Actinomycetes bacterium]|nr:2-phospho-L-lactate guanylyltransferase [Actinomycetes bacterium]